MSDPPLGEQELELLRFITDHAPLSVREAAEQFGKPHGLARTTILTMMERLRNKGYLTREEVGGVNQYSPRLTKSELMRGVVRHFVEKTLGGSLAPFVAYLAEKTELNPKELEELQRLIVELGSNETKTREDGR